MSRSMSQASHTARLEAIRQRLQLDLDGTADNDPSSRMEADADAAALDAAIVALTLPAIDRLRANAPLIMGEIDRMKAARALLDPRYEALQQRVKSFGYKARDWEERETVSVRDALSEARRAIDELLWEENKVAGAIVGFAIGLSEANELIARACIRSEPHL